MPTSSSSSDAASDSLPSSASSEEVDCSLYSSGNTLLLKRHIPPPPCGLCYKKSAPSKSKLCERKSKLELCLMHPPRPGVTNLQETRTITFKSPIRVGDRCGAQVLLTVDGLVAKVYDPLCYYDGNPDWPTDIVDVIANADKDYSNEAAAYSALDNTLLQGTIMPTYYGSWTAEVDVWVEGQKHIRDVRMILMEHIAGIQMTDINPCELTRQARDNIMIKVIEADTDLRIAGLKHKDFAPRNIMLAAPECTTTRSISSRDFDFENPGFRACVVDFATSCVFELAGQQRISAKRHNPLFFWAGSDVYCHYGWMPSCEEATDWMWKVWGDGGQHEKYISVERDSQDLLGRPKRA